MFVFVGVQMLIDFTLIRSVRSTYGARLSTNDKYSATPLATTRSGGTSPGGRTSMATPTALKVPVRINTPLTTNAQHYLVSVLHGPNN